MNKFKGTIIISALILCASSLFSCAQNSTDESSSSDTSVSQQTTAAVSTEPAVTEPLIVGLDDTKILCSLDEMAAANSFSSILNDSVTTYECSAQYYDDAGNKQKTIYTAVRLTEDKAFYISENNTGDKYYLDSEAGRMYSSLYNSYGVPYGIKYMDDISVKEEIARVDTEHTAFSQYAVITDTTVSDDLLIITSETPVNEDTKWDYLDFFEYINIEQDFTKIRNVYVLDAESKLLSCQEVYGVNKDGKEIMIGTFDIIYSSEELKVPDFCGEIEAMTDMRTIKVTDADGNVKEYSVPKNVLFSFPVPTGYMMYTDPEGKDVFSYSDYMDKDAEIYILPY